MAFQSFLSPIHFSETPKEQNEMPKENRLIGIIRNQYFNEDEKNNFLTYACAVRHRCFCTRKRGREH